MPRNAKVVPVSGAPPTASTRPVSKASKFGKVVKAAFTANTKDVITGKAPTGTFGGQIALHTYSDSVYYAHIGKVLLVILILVVITAFIVIGLFYPQCNSTQDHGFYSCSCKAGSALDLTTGQCLCLDTGAVPATAECPAYVANERRYVYESVVPGEDAENGGWVETTEACF
jgi:hypothetical protein